MHGINDFEVGVFRFLKSDPFRTIGKIPNLDSDLVVLIDLDVLEDNFCGYDLKRLSVDGFLLEGTPFE